MTTRSVDSNRDRLNLSHFFLHHKMNDVPCFILIFFVCTTYFTYCMNRELKIDNYILWIVLTDEVIVGKTCFIGLCVESKRNLGFTRVKECALKNFKFSFTLFNTWLLYHETLGSMIIKETSSIKEANYWWEWWYDKKEKITSYIYRV